MSAFRLELNINGVATLTFDLPNEKVNKLSISVLEELENILEIAKKNSAIKILVIKSAKPNMFIAGADLKNFEPAFRDNSLAEKLIGLGHQVFNKLSDLPFPTVAVIDGICLGGGTELALACTYRVVSDNEKTAIGLPEVNLGIFPGWGGTQRLPRHVGIEQGLNLILTGKAIDAKKAFKIKFADAIFAKEFLYENLPSFLKKCLDSKGKKEILEKRKLKGLYHSLMEKNPLGRKLLFHYAEKNVLEKTKGLYPAPLEALNLVKETCNKSLQEGLKIEQETFIEAIPNAFKYAPNLISLFFASEEIKKNPGFSTEIPSKPIKSGAVIGAGTMGSGIAWLLSYYNIPVRLKDIDWESLGKGFAAITAIYHKLLKIKKIETFQFERKIQNISLSIDYSGFNGVDIAIEAATENLELKHKIFAELEQVMHHDAIIASNTSSLSISEMSQFMKFPERFIGMHFFNPPNRMPLVEIVPSDQTSQQTIATAIEICKKFKKVPLVVKDCPGFLVNRVFAMGANETSWMLQEGIEMERLDKVLTEFGMPMGPCALSDEVGNDIANKVFSSLYVAYGERMRPPEILQAMVDADLLGKKNHKGYYLYKRKKIVKNPKVQKIIKKIATPKRSISDTEIIDRFTLSMINEAARCLEEKVVSSPLYVDMGLLYGMGFPPFRFGLLRYADSLGIDNIIKKLNHYTEIYGARFTPCSYLLKIDAFYPEKANNAFDQEKASEKENVIEESKAYSGSDQQ